jgi:hypothetical protein
VVTLSLPRPHGASAPLAFGHRFHLPEQILQHLIHCCLTAFHEVPELGHGIPPAGIVLIYLQQGSLHRIADIITIFDPEVLQFCIIIIYYFLQQKRVSMVSGETLDPNSIDHTIHENSVYTLFSPSACSIILKGCQFGFFISSCQVVTSSAPLIS